MKKLFSIIALLLVSSVSYANDYFVQAKSVPSTIVEGAHVVTGSIFYYGSEFPVDPGIESNDGLKQWIEICSFSKTIRLDETTRDETCKVDLTLTQNEIGAFVLNAAGSDINLGTDYECSCTCTDGTCAPAPAATAVQTDDVRDERPIDPRYQGLPTDEGRRTRPMCEDGKKNKSKYADDEEYRLHGPR